MSDTDTEAFTKCATGNKRKELAERFTQYLKSRDTNDNAYVVNLNGAWGTGKTFFVTEWKKLVEDKGHIAIKIDAWESDYLNDPLAIIIAELLEQIKFKIKNYDPKFRNAERNVASAIFNMGKSMLPIGSKIVGKHLLGEAATSEILDLIASATGSVTNHSAVKDDLNMGDLGLEVARQHKRHKQFTQDFKKQVRELVDFALEDNPNKQVFIFIDELDRCRPTYAIEMLETVKHLFDIPDFIFVLSTDTSQLQHSIKAVYGHDFDSHEYLSRFFEQRFTLPELDYFEFLTAEKIFETEDFKPLPTLPAINSAEELRAAVALICEQNRHHLSLRRVNQICVQLEIVLDSKELRENAYPILTLIGLIFGNALYGGLPKPETPLGRALLALKDSDHPVRILYTVKVLKPQQNGPYVSLETIINNCLTALNELVNQRVSEKVFGQTVIKYTPQIEPAVHLFQNFPVSFMVRRKELSELYQPNQFITDTEKLLQIIENLDIQVDINEK
ncbi:KAP family P-loop domain-containing protein [Marinomonas polaris DSM 16579]|uniref:KAP family P-loop domain-containing protein n=1 Tax=Marinomonas polaris DSM 16579 TaxID=1122206 RepID=A0A1M4XFK6_9GAMM|nr:P-loop NTPase fold protein [Marinomonas polaris]SHE92305.1 KAP family P-loop domain-containing protein [Marinomonas polaris DSM 16579]